jgi:hypothetical protein
MENALVYKNCMVESETPAVPSFSSKENAPVDWHELVYGPSISLNTIFLHGLPSSID